MEPSDAESLLAETNALGKRTKDALRVRTPVPYFVWGVAALLSFPVPYLYVRDLDSSSVVLRQLNPTTMMLLYWVVASIVCLLASHRAARRQPVVPPQSTRTPTGHALAVAGVATVIIVGILAVPTAIRTGSAIHAVAGLAVVAQAHENRERILRLSAIGAILAAVGAALLAYNADLTTDHLDRMETAMSLAGLGMALPLLVAGLFARPKIRRIDDPSE